jgi:hypothetical protein
LRRSLFDRRAFGSEKTVPRNVQRLDVETTLFQVDPYLSAFAYRQHRATGSVSEVE